MTTDLVSWLFSVILLSISLQIMKSEEREKKVFFFEMLSHLILTRWGVQKNIFCWTLLLCSVVWIFIESFWLHTCCFSYFLTGFCPYIWLIYVREKPSDFTWDWFADFFDFSENKESGSDLFFWRLALYGSEIFECRDLRLFYAAIFGAGTVRLEF